LRYPDTLQLVSRLAQRRPSAALPSRLNELFVKLSACPSATAAERLEDAIWGAWMYHGHEGAELALSRAADDMAARRFDIAETRLAQLLRCRPDWAEAWNKLATLYYLADRDDECVGALHRALALEPRHFGALASFGEVLRAQEETEAARVAFGSALRLHPHLAGARQAMQELGAC
jgi:tetratricopeptide (TPR) repeat protein